MVVTTATLSGSGSGTDNCAIRQSRARLFLFDGAVWKWSGRLEDLDPEQLDNYMASLKVLIDAEERRLLERPKQLEAGPVVDIQATESSTTA